MIEDLLPCKTKPYNNAKDIQEAFESLNKGDSVRKSEVNDDRSDTDMKNYLKKKKKMNLE